MSREIKIYRMNDCDWVMAPNLRAAIREYEGVTMATRREILEDRPRPLTEEELDSNIFKDDVYRDNSAERTFREEMEKRIAQGVETDMFATSEY